MFEIIHTTEDILRNFSK